MNKTNTIHNIINRNIERQLVREYLLKETERAGFGGLEFNRTPEGTKVTLSAEQVGRVIGRRGKIIHELQRRLQNDFNLEKPRLEVDQNVLSKGEGEIDAMLQNRPTQPGGRRPGQGPTRGQGGPGGPNA